MDEGDNLRRGTRRSFFRQAAVLTSLPACAAGDTVSFHWGPPPRDPRQRASLAMRQEAALLQSLQPVPNQISNGDERSLPRYIACFTKGLPHDQLGEVDPE